MTQSGGVCAVGPTIILDNPRDIVINNDGSIVVFVSYVTTNTKYSANGINGTYNTLVAPWLVNSAIITDETNPNLIVSSFSNTDCKIAIRNLITGSSWNEIILATGLSSTPTQVRGSGNGKYLFVAHGSYTSFVSDDYGVSWTQVLIGETPYYYSIGVSHSGKYMVVPDINVINKYFLSTDYGVSWSVKNISGVTNFIRAIAIQDPII